MGKVYDFNTGREARRCEICRWWKDAEDAFNRWSKICKECEKDIVEPGYFPVDSDDVA